MARVGCTPYDCQPTCDSTMSPGASDSSRDSTTSATVPPGMTAPSSTGAAYDLASLIRPRMYGSSDR